MCYFMPVKKHRRSYYATRNYAKYISTCTITGMLWRAMGFDTGIVASWCTKIKFSACLADFLLTNHPCMLG